MSASAGAIRARRRQETDPTLLAALGELPPATMVAVWLGALLRRKGATKMGRRSKLVHCDPLLLYIRFKTTLI
jgi:hypothetical protein